MGVFRKQIFLENCFMKGSSKAREKGLTEGGCWRVEATLVRANAAMRSFEAIVVPFSKEEYLKTLDKSAPDQDTEKSKDETAIHPKNHQ